MCMLLLQGIINEFSKKRDRPTHTPPARNFIVDTDSDLVKNLQPCDIVLYRFTGKKDLTGGVISYITSSPYSHAEIHMFDGYDVSAGAHGVTFTDIYWGNLVHGYVVDVLRLNREMTREERLIIQAKAYQAIHQPYDYTNLIFFPFMGAKAAAQKAGNDAYMCSELTAWAYNNAGIDLIKGKPESIEAPCDIGRSAILNYVGTFMGGKKISGDFRNQFIGEEYSFAAKMIAKLMGAFTVKDEYYKGLYLNKSLLEGQA